MDYSKIPDRVKIDGDWETKEVYVDGKWLTPGRSTRLRQHADTFGWGYGGSGPGQLSLAILLWFLPVDDALRLYMRFKFKVVGAWPQSDFEDVINLREIIMELDKQSD